MPSRLVDTSKVILIPFDPNSKQHADRLYLQRLDCGWRADKIAKWQAKQRKGKMNLHWIVLSDEYPDKEIQLKRHIENFPTEATPILDTAETLGGKDRVPPTPSKSFIPVGHISLDSESDDPTQADPEKGIYNITTFYVSRALQSGGIGRAAMDAVEAMAINEPLCAKTLTLDTLENKFALNKEMWAIFNIPPPKMSMQDWYARRGYEVYKYEDGKYKEETPAGSEWVLTAVFMKKDVV